MPSASVTQLQMLSYVFKLKNLLRAH